MSLEDTVIENPPTTPDADGDEAVTAHRAGPSHADAERAEGDDDSTEGHLVRGRKGADAERAEGDDDSTEGHVFRPSEKPPTRSS